ncbi:MAG: serine/threonine-protein kinase, partial [Sarcina sp.]|nr:serine/threonine-protein kinase [Sarcina sp.]
AEHGVTLVQDTTSGIVYVKKILTIYNAEVYRTLKNHPVPGIPEIIEMIEEDDRLIVIEEYIGGQTLRAILDNGNLFPEEEAVRIVEQVCVIINDLHSADPPIIHRDIKPSNIICTPDGSIRLLDMNAARKVVTGKSEDTQLIGTVGYAAPEQFGFGASTVQTDIYAIGVLLCELMTGVLPKERIPRGRIGRIIRKCTRLDPKDRYKSVRDLLDALAAGHGYSTGVTYSSPGRSHSGIKRKWKYMIPGYRTGSPVNILIATSVYAFFLSLVINLEVKDIPPGIVLWAVRLVYLIFGLGILFFTGNYLNIWDRLRISRIRNPLIRLFVVLLIDAVLVVAMVFAMVLTAVAMGVYKSKYF